MPKSKFKFKLRDHPHLFPKNRTFGPRGSFFVDKQAFTMWDDCMSFPDLYVRVQRSRSISIEYQDETGSLRKWEDIGRVESELLQHETDHLNGILSVDLALDKHSIIYKTEFNKNRDFYQRQVDYMIEPTIS